MRVLAQFVHEAFVIAAIAVVFSMWVISMVWWPWTIGLWVVIGMAILAFDNKFDY